MNILQIPSMLAKNVERAHTSSIKIQVKYIENKENMNTSKLSDI